MKKEKQDEEEKRKQDEEEKRKDKEDDQQSQTLFAIHESIGKTENRERKLAKLYKKQS